jgi:hypothetical protein
LIAANARSVLGYCPQKLQIDPRIYGIASSCALPYASIDPRNPALACEVVRQMRIDFVVATRAESLLLQEALRQRLLPEPTWHIIVPKSEQELSVPSGAFVDVHEFPGRPYAA